MKNVFSKKCICFLGVLFCFGYNESTAQLKDCNAFIQGNYIEIGVNYNGSYGSSTPPPPGYHAKFNFTSTRPKNSISCTTTPASPERIGFVADPEKDGWSTAKVGSPNYMGDYFLPGVPFEGWSIMTTKQVNSWNGFDDSLGKFSSSLNGDNVRYFATGRLRATEWEGTYDSLQIIQRTILDTANTYFVIRVKIKNLAHKKRGPIYYMRSIDPDNDQMLPLGGFSTDNTIQFQNPNPANICVVSATGRGYSSSIGYLGLGTKDSRAKVFLDTAWGHPDKSTLDNIYSGLDTFCFLGSGATYLNRDLAIGLLFKIDSLPSFDSTILTMAYMFGSGTDINQATGDMGLLPGEELGLNSVNLNDDNIKVIPNPFRNELTVKGLEKNDKIEIYNIQGCKMKGEWTENSLDKTLNASSLANGLYIIIVRSENGAIKLRKTIQHI
jgi:hypothetical protein